MDVIKIFPNWKAFCSSLLLFDSSSSLTFLTHSPNVCFIGSTCVSFSLSIFMLFFLLHVPLFVPLRLAVNLTVLYMCYMSFLCLSVHSLYGYICLQWTMLKSPVTPLISVSNCLYDHAFVQSLFITSSSNCVNSKSFAKWLFFLALLSSSPGYKKWITGVSPAAGSLPAQFILSENSFSMRIQS